MMSVLLGHHEAFSLHEPGRGHPERPERLDAVFDGIQAAGLEEAVEEFAPRSATAEELARVHGPGVIAWVEELAAVGGAFDPDTLVGPGSFEAALRAAGAGPDAVERLDRGEGRAAFLAVRPARPPRRRRTGRWASACSTTSR